MRTQVTTDRPEAAAATIDPPRIVEQAESSGQILAALGHLPVSQQEVVRLKFQSDLSYRDIATITGLSVTNVGYLLHTAIQKLREQMQQDE